MTGPDDGEAQTGAHALQVAAPLLAADEGYLGLTALGPVPTERTVREQALVLQSMSVWHVIKRTPAGWILLVRDADYPKAADSLARYEQENRDWPPPRRRERPRHAPSGWTPLVFTALVAFFMITGPAALGSRWFDRGTAISDVLLFHEPWRAVTALTLHADSVHVLGNAISGTVFGAAVNRRLGAGAGVLAILMGGVLGNVGNALWHHASGAGGHQSIGASTAVFGAIGVLAATQLAVHRPPREVARGWLDVAGPIVGGFALLGALGAGGGTANGARLVDLGAHLFGLLGGIVLGLVAALVLRQKAAPPAFVLERGAAGPGSAQVAHEHVALGAGAPSPVLQAVAGASAAVIVLVSWALALRR